MPDWLIALLFLTAAAVVLLMMVAVLLVPVHLWLQWESERTIKRLRGDELD